MISAQRFTWNDYSSLDFDVIADVSFDGDSGEIETYLSREAVMSETYNGALKRGSSYKWSESMTPTITIVKNDFGDFTPEENRKILKWITGRQTPGFIDIYKDDSDVIEYSILGNFTSVSQYKLGNTRVVGYILQFESLAPYAYSQLNTIPINFVATNQSTMKDVSLTTNNSFTIKVDTDDPEAAVYPKITIKQNGTNYIRIANATTLTATSEIIDNTAYFNGTTYYWKVNGVFNSAATNPNLTTTSIKITNVYVDDNNVSHSAVCYVANNTLDETIILDGANKVISSSRTSRIFGNDFNWEWTPLYDGNNQITIEGNCKVGIEYREVRKVGAL